jgi:hypothetical protein
MTLNCFSRCIESSRAATGMMPKGFVQTDNER